MELLLGRKTLENEILEGGIELQDAVSVMRQFAAWFEDYNEVQPRNGLRMQSPGEYRRERPRTPS